MKEAEGAIGNKHIYCYCDQPRTRGSPRCSASNSHSYKRISPKNRGLQLTKQLHGLFLP